MIQLTFPAKPFSISLKGYPPTMNVPTAPIADPMIAWNINSTDVSANPMHMKTPVTG